MTNQTDARQADRRRRLLRLIVLGVAGLVTVMAAVLVVAAYRNDAAIEANRVAANAQVISQDWARTTVRFTGPDGRVFISQDGVLYPGGLVEGQRLLVEYDGTNPNLVRVAGRTADLTLLPAGSTVVITWLVAAPLLWWLRPKRSGGTGSVDAAAGTSSEDKVGDNSGDNAGDSADDNAGDNADEKVDDKAEEKTAGKPGETADRKADGDPHPADATRNSTFVTED
jgi:hypothetical protein